VAPRSLIQASKVTNTKIAVMLLALTALGACQREKRAGDHTISPERFIEANVALRQVAGDTVDAIALRESVLEEQGITEDDLRAFVTARSDRPGELAAIWDEIYVRLIDAEEPEELSDEEADRLELPRPGGAALSDEVLSEPVDIPSRSAEVYPGTDRRTGGRGRLQRVQ
jgi:hypothetical protein